MRDKVLQESNEKLRGMKETWAREQDEALETQRLEFRNRLKEQFDSFEKQLLAERAGFQEQAKKLQENFEKTRQEENAIMDKKLQEAFLAERKQQEERVAQLEGQIEEQKRKHALEISNLKQQVSVEREEWVASLSSKMKREAQEKVMRIKEQLQSERDKHLETLVDRLSKEQIELKETHKKQIETEVWQAKQALQKDIEQTQAQRRDALAQLHESDIERQKLRQQIDGMHNALRMSENRCQELIDSKEKIENAFQALRAESERMRGDMEAQIREIRETQQAEVHRAQQEVMQLRDTLGALAERRVQEQKELQAMYEEKFASVHAQARQGVVNRDAHINELKQQVQAAEAKSVYLQGLLEKQRNELLGIGQIAK
eukprot:GDKI01020594.1.p1 GENE.GDKI01020594.1~~GDKI01020594.1.p1  ORF type:complete len:374 (-),score=106.01 GDKI01020594.1:169-1290(-)